MTVRMNRDVLWRAICQLNSLLAGFQYTTERNKYDYHRLDEYHNKICGIGEMLDTDEQTFLEWTTKSYHESDGSYCVSSDKYGISLGREHPECYKNAHVMIDILSDNETTFNYIYAEYVAIQNAKDSVRVMEEREGRTCPDCETRFDTWQGMQRHRSRCNGVYRGEYHGRTKADKDGWGDEKTSTW
jgi:hypothetical protein